MMSAGCLGSGLPGNVQPNYKGDRYRLAQSRMRRRDEPARFGIVLYDGVEPIDVGGTIGVVSMAARVLPAIEAVTIAHPRVQSRWQAA